MIVNISFTEQHGVPMEEKNYFMWLNAVLFGRVAGL
jgi:hypothetical protein